MLGQLAVVGGANVRDSDFCRVKLATGSHGAYKRNLRF